MSTLLKLDFVGLKTKEEFQSLKDAAEEEYLRQHQYVAAYCVKISIV